MCLLLTHCHVTHVSNSFLDQLISLVSSLPSTTCPCLSGQSINHYGYKTVLFCPCSMTSPGCHRPLVTSHTQEMGARSPEVAKRPVALNIQILACARSYMHAQKQKGTRALRSKQAAKMKAVVGNALTWF